VAVLNFEYGTLEHWWSGNQDIGQGISDLLVDELVNDGSFRMIERKRLDAILAEQNFSQSERADPSAKTLAQVGKVLGVKYLVVGSVTKFGTEKSNKSFGAGGFGSKYGVGEVGTAKGKANVAITARMISTTTGEILISQAVVAAARAWAGSSSVRPTSVTRSSARRPRWPSSRPLHSCS
jgi:curli biogenesis system outer membrane secretion channel CsgG